MESTFIFSLASMPAIPAGQAPLAVQKNGLDFLEVLEAEIRLLAENLPTETSQLKQPATEGSEILAAASAETVAAVEPGKLRVEDRNDEIRSRPLDLRTEEQLDMMVGLLVMVVNPARFTPDSVPQAAPPGNPEAGDLSMAPTEEALLHPTAAAPANSADLPPAKPAALNTSENPPLRVVTQDELLLGAGSAAKTDTNVERQAPDDKNSGPVVAPEKATEVSDSRADPYKKPVTAHNNKDGVPVMPVNVSSSPVESPVMRVDVSSQPVEVQPVLPMEALPVNLQAVSEGMGITRPVTGIPTQAQHGEAATATPAKHAMANPALRVSDAPKQPQAENEIPAEMRQPGSMPAGPIELRAGEPVQRMAAGMEPVMPALHSLVETELPREAPRTTTESKPNGVVPATSSEEDLGKASSVKPVEMRPSPQEPVVVVETRSLKAAAAAPVETAQGESLLSPTQQETPTQKGAEIRPAKHQPGGLVGLRMDALPGEQALRHPNAASVPVSGDDPRQAGAASVERAPFQALSKSAAGKYAGGESSGLELAQFAGLKSGVTAPNLVEPARMAEAHNNGLIRQVSQNIEVLAKTGQTSLKIHLQPNDLQIHDLGKIDLHLTSTTDGMQVSITAERPVTGLLLERHLNELRQSLSDAGVQLSGLSVGLSSSQDHSATAQHWQSARAEAAPTPRQKKQPETDLQEHTPARRLETDLRVDYRI